jgi:GNAT superfamily N-acetyltransferase
MTTIERLVLLPPDRLERLAAEAEGAGHRFVRRLVEEWEAGINRFDRPGEALWAATNGGLIVGVCGLNADPYTSEGRVGRVRRLYVLAAERGRGIGRSLVERVVAAAWNSFDRLRLRTLNPDAARFYERLGFAPCAEGDTTHVLYRPRIGED